MTDKFNLCKVCDFDCSPFFPWGEDGLTPSYSICPQCGVEFGYEDTSEAGIKYQLEKFRAKKQADAKP